MEGTSASSTPASWPPDCGRPPRRDAPVPSDVNAAGPTDGPAAQCQVSGWAALHSRGASSTTLQPPPRPWSAPAGWLHTRCLGAVRRTRAVCWGAAAGTRLLVAPSRCEKPPITGRWSHTPSGGQARDSCVRHLSTHGRSPLRRNDAFLLAATSDQRSHCGAVAVQMPCAAPHALPGLIRHRRVACQRRVGVSSRRGSVNATVLGPQRAHGRPQRSLVRVHAAAAAGAPLDDPYAVRAPCACAGNARSRKTALSTIFT